MNEPTQDTKEGGFENMGTPIAIVIAGAMVAAALYFGGSGTAGTAVRQPANNDAAAKAENVVPVSTEDHILGNPDAPVKIIEYTDLECPFCKQFHGTMKAVMDTYGAEGKVAWVVRNFPLEQLHPNAPRLALAAECVAAVGGNQAYWNFLDEIVRIAPLNTPFDMTKLETTVAKFAPGTSVMECVEAGTFTEKINQQIADAVASGGTGTPHSILIDAKGRATLIQGSQPLEVVKGMIDKALK
ncbi:MAG: DsbA family protein [Candidatus Pacebacteria bacterium]|nr:DsbA family protein [Candidatus Paceibacterota bacterium]